MLGPTVLGGGSQEPGLQGRISTSGRSQLLQEQEGLEVEDPSGGCVTEGRVTRTGASVQNVPEPAGAEVGDWLAAGVRGRYQVGERAGSWECGEWQTREGQLATGR